MMKLLKELRIAFNLVLFVNISIIQKLGLEIHTVNYIMLDNVS